MTPQSRNFFLYSTVCVLTLGLLPVSRTYAADTALDDYKLAVGLYKKDRWDLAADSFRKFLKEHATNPRAESARLYLGIALENDEKYTDARTVFREFLKKHPTSGNLPDAMYRTAECSYFLNDVAPAEREFLAFLNKYSKHKLAEWAYPYLADAQLRQNKPQAALDNFQIAIKAFPNSELAVDAQFGSARAYEQLKQFPQAVSLYQKISADPKAPRAPEAELNLAALHFETGKFLEAAQTYDHFSKTYSQHPQAPNAQLNSGYAWYELGDYTKATAQFDRAAKNKPLATTAQYWKGVSLKSLGRYADAATTLQTAFKAAAENPFKSEILFQWADSELRNNNVQQAQTLFLDYLNKNPQSELADDSLHFAAEASLLHAEQLADAQQKKSLTQSQQLLDRFKRDFPDSQLRMHHELLQGRLLYARENKADYRQALTHFQKVLDGSTIPHTQSLARFQLARTYNKLEDNQKLVEINAPLIEQVKQEKKVSEFVDALILEGLGRLALKQFDQASSAASLYLQFNPDGSQADQALATRARAQITLDGETAQTQAHNDLLLLAKNHIRSPLTLQTWHQVAEAAYNKNNWDFSSQLFTELIEKSHNSPYHVLALSGLAWTHFQQKKYTEAAELFTQVVKLYPNEKILAPESAYKQAESLQLAQQRDQAAEAYANAFQKFAPATPAKPGDEQTKGSGYYAYRSGLQAARTLRSLKKFKEADAAFEQLLKRFPAPKDLDNRLDEWALLNYEAKNYTRSDEIFHRLIKQIPDSPLADNARFSLAESSLNAGRLAEARTEFTKLSVDPKSDDEVRETSLHHLVTIAVESQNWKDVITNSEKLLNSFPKSLYRNSTQFYRAEAQFHLNQFDQAEQILAKLKTESEDGTTKADWFPRVWIILAELQLRHKKYDDVTKTVAELNQLHPQSPILYQADEILGRSYKNKALFDEARTAFQRVIDSPNGTRTETAAKSQFLIAETHLIQKQYREAQRAYFKVYTLYEFPDWQAPALLQVAVCDESLKQWANAVKTYEDLIKQFPKSEYAKNAKSRLPLARKNAGR